MKILRLSAPAVLLILVDLSLATKRKDPPLSPNNRAHIIGCNVRLIETDSLGYESTIEEKPISPSGTQTFQYGKDNIYVGVNKLCEVMEARGLRKDMTHLEFEITVHDVNGKVKRIRRSY